MKRTLFVVAVLVAFGFATSAGAATLSVVSDKTTYNVGETITLSISGDGQGATAYSVFGRLLYNAALANPGTQNQNAIGAAWIPGPLGAVDGISEAINQIENTFAGSQATGLPAGNPFSIVTLIAEAVGTVNVTWDTVGAGFQLSFFGLTDAPGATFSIVPIPEPTTAALLGLGLVGLVVGGRRRS